MTTYAVLWRHVDEILQPSQLRQWIADVSINDVGHAETWDRVEVDGDAATHDVAVQFLRGGRLLAMATLFRDEESLRAEIEMEHRHRQGGSASTP